MSSNDTFSPLGACMVVARDSFTFAHFIHYYLQDSILMPLQYSTAIFCENSKGNLDLAGLNPPGTSNRKNEAQNLLGCTAVFLVECPTDVSEVRVASIVALMMEAARTSETSVDI
jgi:hypothetical protein